MVERFVDGDTVVDGVVDGETVVDGGCWVVVVRERIVDGASVVEVGVVDGGGGGAEAGSLSSPRR